MKAFKRWWMFRAVQQGCSDKRKAEIVVKAVVEEEQGCSCCCSNFVDQCLCARGGMMGFSWLVPSLSSPPLKSGRQQKGPSLIVITTKEGRLTTSIDYSRSSHSLPSA